MLFFGKYFFEDKVLKIVDVHLDGSLTKGTGTLLNSINKKVGTIIFTSDSYPPAIPGIGTPFPTKFNYSLIRDGENYINLCIENDFVDSLTGTGIYFINSGTNPERSNITLPYGIYQSVLKDDDSNDFYKIRFDLNKDGSWLIIE
jgi:hypothetical protein